MYELLFNSNTNAATTLALVAWECQVVVRASVAVCNWSVKMAG
jgi:predicted ABC-type transport system involved in lysophospholipase L1 biosynthesis ATPase subunit